MNSPSAREPRRFFYGWLLAGVALLLQMVSIGTVSYSYSIVTLPFLAEFDASRTAMMMGITIMPLASAAMAPFLGKLIDQKSLRLFTLLGTMLLPAGFFLLSMITAMWQVPIIYAVCMSYAMLMLGPLGTSTLLSRWFKERLALAMGIAAIGTSIGGFVFPPLISWLMDNYGWREALRLLSLTVATITIPAALLIVNRPADRNLRALGMKSDTPTAAVEQTPPNVFKDRNFWLVAGVLGALFAAYGAVLSNLAPFAVETGVPQDKAALYIALIAIAGIVGKLGFGYIADSVDLRLALGTAVLLVIAGLGCFVAGGTGGTTLLTVGCLSFGLAAGGMLPVWGAMLAWLFGVAHYGRVMGLMNFCIIPLTVVAPILTGLLRDQRGNYSAAFTLFMVVLGLSLFLLAAIRPPEQTLEAASV